MLPMIQDSSMKPSAISGLTFIDGRAWSYPDAWTSSVFEAHGGAREGRVNELS